MSLTMDPDSQLSKLLGSWEATPEVPPGFRREVWARIGQRRTGPATAFLGWIGGFSLPRLAAAAAVALVAGVFAGSLQARSAGESLYLRSVDPLSLHAHGHDR